MKTRTTAIALAAALGLTALGAGAAQAAIVNISATGGGPSFYTFQTGSYRIEWIGVADGGAYNGWNQSCPQGGCTLGWHNNYQVVTGSGPNPDLINFGIVGGGAQGSALANLASFKNSPNMVLNFLEWHNGAYNVVNNEFTTNPFVHYFGGPITLAFVTGDGTPRDNFGGVSLRITQGVPEPSTWAMMIAGFGLAGAALRSRRRAAA